MRKVFLIILAAVVFSIGVFAYHHARSGARPPQYPDTYDRKPPVPAIRDEYAYPKPSNEDNDSTPPSAVAPEAPESQPAPAASPDEQSSPAPAASPDEQTSPAPAASPEDSSDVIPVDNPEA